ncbi:hypothetical protein D3C86_1191650 [compost metagenome]
MAADGEIDIAFDDKMTGGFRRGLADFRVVDKRAHRRTGGRGTRDENLRSFELDGSDLNARR